MPTGAFYGITTNPAILEKDGEQCTEDNLVALMLSAAEMGAREIQFQAWGGSEEALVASGLFIAALDQGAEGGIQTVVKVPGTYEGTRAARRLVEEGEFSMPALKRGQRHGGPPAQGPGPDPWTCSPPAQGPG